MLTKFGSSAMVGQFIFGLTITAPLFALANLDLKNIQATDSRGEYIFSEYLSLEMITVLCALGIVAGIVLFSGYTREISLIILAVGVSKAIECISGVFFGLFQQRERMDRVGRSLMLKGPLSLFGMAFGVYLTDSVLGGAGALVVMWALVLFAYDIRNGVLILKFMPHSGISQTKAGKGREVLGNRWKWTRLGKLFRLSFPRGLSELFISLQTNIPRYFVEQYLGSSMLGIFAALAYFDRPGKLFMHALGLSAAPRLSQQYNAGNARYFALFLTKLVGIGALLGVGGVLVAFVGGELILTLFYRPEYARQDVFFLFMVAAGLGYMSTILTYGLIASRRLRSQMFLEVSIMALLILLCVWLIPSDGLHGAAMALVIARSVEVGIALSITVASVLALRKPGILELAKNLRNNMPGAKNA